MNNQKTAARTSGRIPAKETALFCTQAGLLLKAGIPLGDGLASLTEEGTGAGGSFCAGLRIQPGKPARCMKRSGRSAFSPLTWCI